MSEGVLRCLCLAGPTAAGKTAAALAIADALPVEIVSVDSALVYRGMDIGTAKPTPAERRGVRHHLVDVMDVTQTASVAEFQAAARAVMERCRARGVLPIVVGGSALYMRAILDHFEFPGTDADVRARWEAELDRVGPEALHAVLAERAPDTAAEILPGNGRRIVRALEVLELTGGHAPTLPEWTYALPNVVSVGLEVDRALMDARIAERVDRMWADGLVDEVRALERRGLRTGRTASLAIGYRQVLQFLDGELTEDEAKQAIVTATKRFARKQLGWFRRDARVTWYPAGEPGLAQTLAEQLTR